MLCTDIFLKTEDCEVGSPYIEVNMAHYILQR